MRGPYDAKINAYSKIFEDMVHQSWIATDESPTSKFQMQCLDTSQLPSVEHKSELWESSRLKV